jgi:hypothetical protein
VLQYHFNWKTRPVISESTLWNFYFQMFQMSTRAIRAPQIEASLKPLPRHVPGKLLLVRDWLPVHRSR